MRSIQASRIDGHTLLVLLQSLRKLVFVCVRRPFAQYNDRVFGDWIERYMSVSRWKSLQAFKPPEKDFSSFDCFVLHTHCIFIFHEDAFSRFYYFQ